MNYKILSLTVIAAAALILSSVEVFARGGGGFHGGGGGFHGGGGSFSASRSTSLRRGGGFSHSGATRRSFPGGGYTDGGGGGRPLAGVSRGPSTGVLSEGAAIS